MTDPWPSEGELDAAYAGFYRPDSGRFSGPGDAILRHSRASLARRVDQLAPAGPVLDVGAGDGALVDALARRGREAVGLEREARPPRVRAGEIEGVEGEWAAIVFWHSLEHLRAPAQALDAAIARLAKGGVLIMALPNASSLQARVFGAAWLALDLPRHLVHVPSEALIGRLHERGLQLGRISYLRGGQVMFGWLHGLAGFLPGHPDLYDAIRRPEARQRPLSPRGRTAVLAGAIALAPVAALATVIEAGMRRGGSLYVEARRD